MTRALFTDTSALARVYLDDEPESDQLRSLLRGSGEAVIASELVRVELARAAKNAERAKRISDVDPVLQRIEADLSGPIGLVDLDPSAVLPSARRLVLEHRLGTLDAIHLAVALEERRRSPDPVVFVTRDADQAAAANALGFAVL